VTNRSSPERSADVSTGDIRNNATEKNNRHLVSDMELPAQRSAEIVVVALRLGVSLKSESNFRRLTLSMGAIGITSTILAILAPQFSITTSVGSIVSIPVAGTVISVCMFGGSLVSARLRRRRFRLKWPTIKGIARRTLGGILMGLGALLIPGGNDTLLMIGFSIGAWQAALAYVLFVASLAALITKFGSMARSWR
jgi:hypothetical protein